MPFLLYGSFHVSSNHHSGWMPCHIWSRKMASLLCGSFHVSSNHHLGWMTCYICSRQMRMTCDGFSPKWILSCFFTWPLWLNDLSHLEQENGFSPVDPSMCLQITTRVGWLVTFGVGRWLLSSVDPFMRLQITTLIECLDIWSRQMASPLCGSFHVSSTHHSGWMTC